EGRYIDLSMAEAISLLVGHTVAQAGLGQPPQRLGNRDRDFAPQGVYPAHGDDEWVALTVQDDRQWDALLRVLAHAPSDPPVDAAALERLRREDLRTAAGRRAAHDEFDAVLAPWTRTF